MFHSGGDGRPMLSSGGASGDRGCCCRALNCEAPTEGWNRTAHPSARTAVATISFSSSIMIHSGASFLPRAPSALNLDLLGPGKGIA